MSEPPSKRKKLCADGNTSALELYDTAIAKYRDVLQRLEKARESLSGDTSADAFVDSARLFRHFEDYQ
jgi:hypothetical protein